MAFLDIVILDDAKNEVASISINSQTHQNLIQVASPMTRYPNIERLQDFYKDTKFELIEINDLEHEIVQLRSVVESVGSYPSEIKNNILKFLQDFENQCVMARNLNLPIYCFSD